jgi:hypothetical protein
MEVIRFDKQAPFLDKLDRESRFHPDWFVCAQEFSHGSRNYIIWENLERFIRAYEGLGYRRCHHEFIRGNLPCRLFLDLDMKDPLVTVEEFKDRVETLIVAVKKALGSLYTGEPIIWWCNRLSKYSAHVVFDYWFRQACQIKPFIMSLGLTDEMIDFKPYPNASAKNIRQIRMPYSSKEYRHGPPSAFVLRTSPNIQFEGEVQAEGIWNRDLLLKSLVTIKPPLDAVFHPIPIGLPAHFEEEEDEEETAASGDLLYEQKRRIEIWLKEKKGIRNINKDDQFHHFSWHLTPNLYCPVKGNRHASNHTYLNVTFHDAQALTGKFFCTDCNFSWFPETPINLIANPHLYKEDLSGKKYPFTTKPQ